MKASTWASIAVAALLLLASSVFVIPEGQTALVLNLGKVVRWDLKPGLHFKLPLVESLRRFDRRLQVLAAPAERYLTSERKDVSVDFVAIGYIDDVRSFYRATGGVESSAAEAVGAGAAGSGAEVVTESPPPPPRCSRARGSALSPRSQRSGSQPQERTPRWRCASPTAPATRRARPGRSAPDSAASTRRRACRWC